jgi:hypothetical protein
MDEEGAVSSEDTAPSWNPGSSSDSNWIDQKEAARTRDDALRQDEVSRQGQLQAARRQGFARLIVERERAIERELARDAPNTLTVNAFRASLAQLRRQLEGAT